jgi:hypothetical protein
MNRQLLDRLVDKIYQILVEEAGASPESFPEFHAVVLTRESGEFRFGGKLGFGGKYRWNDSRHYVDYYPEDKTQERDEIVAVTNKRLVNPFQELVDPQRQTRK